MASLAIVGPTFEVSSDSVPLLPFTFAKAACTSPYSCFSTSGLVFSILYGVVIFTWSKPPKVFTSTAFPSKVVFKALLMSSVLAVFSNLAMYVRPPKKSTPKPKPLKKIETIPKIIIVLEIV